MVTPRKSLGQNFLTDRNLAKWIADQIEPERAGVVIEVGPGMGALTEHLAGRAQDLVLVEKDAQIAPELERRFTGREDVRVLHEDATRLDLRPWFPAGDVRVIGNLPYSVGGEILRRFLTVPTPVTEAVFMLQKEVCERLAAKVGDDAYGGLSLLVQKDWNIEILRIVPPEVFQPRPKVDSAVIRVTPRRADLLPVFDRKRFDDLVRTGFSQRRKQLKNLLLLPPRGWEPLTEALGVPLTVRAEELSLAQWVQMARWYERRFDGEQEGQKPTEMFDVVDEQNKVTGQLPRGEVHARGLRHRAVHVFVLNSLGEIYLQRRSHLKDVAPLKWDSSAAGHLDVSEPYAAAAVREAWEELGIKIDSTVKVAELPASERTDNEFVELHAARHDGPMRCLPEEIDCGEWFAPTIITGWVENRPQDFAKGFVECWRAWLRSQSA